MKSNLFGQSISNESEKVKIGSLKDKSKTGITQKKSNRRIPKQNQRTSQIFEKGCLKDLFKSVIICISYRKMNFVVTFSALISKVHEGSSPD